MEICHQTEGQDRQRSQARCQVLNKSFFANRLLLLDRSPSSNVSSKNKKKFLTENVASLMNGLT